MENSVITNSSTADQPPDHLFIRKPVSLGAGENKTKSIKTMTKTFFKKRKNFVKGKKKTQNVGQTQPANFSTCQTRRCLSAKQAFP